MSEPEVRLALPSSYSNKINNIYLFVISYICLQNIHDDSPPLVYVHITSQLDFFGSEGIHMS